MKTTLDPIVRGLLVHLTIIFYHYYTRLHEKTTFDAIKQMFCIAANKYQKSLKSTALLQLTRNEDPLRGSFLGLLAAVD